MVVTSAAQAAAETAELGAMTSFGRARVLPFATTFSETTVVVVLPRPSSRLELTVQVAAAGSTSVKVVTVPSVSESVKSPAANEPRSVRSSSPGCGTQPLLAALAVKEVVPPSAFTTSSEVVEVFRISV